MLQRNVTQSLPFRGYHSDRIEFSDDSPKASAGDFHV